MTSKQQLQTKIRELETQLAEFKTQLNSYKTPTIQEASVGDTLEDGSIVLQKSNGLALLVAPASTQVTSIWVPQFAKVDSKLEHQGFVLSQWFVPTIDQLELAYKVLGKEFFSPTIYWSSTENNSNLAWSVDFSNGIGIYSGKTNEYCVRAFRCVSY